MSFKLGTIGVSSKTSSTCIAPFEHGLSWLSQKKLLRRSPRLERISIADSFQLLVHVPHEGGQKGRNDTKTPKKSPVNFSRRSL